MTTATTPTLTALRGGAPEVPPRERETLVGMARGWTNARIARDMVLSEDTVKSHVHRLLRRIGADSRAHAVAIGVRTGLLALDDGVVVDAAGLRRRAEVAESHARAAAAEQHRLAGLLLHARHTHPTRLVGCPRCRAIGTAVRHAQARRAAAHITPGGAA